MCRPLPRMRKPVPIKRKSKIEMMEDVITREQGAAVKDDEWGESLPPGQELSDYQPRPPPSSPPPLPASSSSSADVGRSPNPFLEKPLKGDVEAEAAEVGVCGLLNMGNTCYLNSALQCLRIVPSLAHHFLTLPQDAAGPLEGAKKEGCSEDREVACRRHLKHSFSTLLRKMWSGRFSAVLPRSFKTTLGLLRPQFNGSRQQDCQEFMSVLLDSVHEDGSTNSHSDISRTFHGSLRNEVVCGKCQHVSSKTEPFVFLSVPLPHAFETQLELVWVSVCGGRREVVRVLVTVLNDACVRGVKCEAVRVVGGGDGLQERLVLAEVKDSSIARILPDAVLVKNVDCKEHSLYCFETGALNQAEAMETTPAQTSDSAHFEANDKASDGSGALPPNGVAPGNKHSREEAIEALPSKFLKSDGMERPAATNGESPDVVAMDNWDAPSVTTATTVVMEWHSCSICLEEMVDSELVSHGECGGVVCPGCLQSSVEHYCSKETGLMPCPLCARHVRPGEAFTPLATTSSDDTIIRLLQMTVLFRSLDQAGQPSLFGHPAVLNLPSNGTGIHDAVARLLPPEAPPLSWGVALTDSKGRFCSRCDFTADCRGCLLERENPTPLKPGDHLAVTFQQLPADIRAQAAGFTAHPSLSLKRGTELSLNECLAAFSDPEELGPDNPWLCPQCERHQSAVRSLSVCHLPDTLIVHLKRFVYHGTGTKLDVPVRFPLELSPQTVCAQHPDSTPLRLTAAVCHFGTLHSGHYTAYGLLPTTEQWYYYNDESFKQSPPSADDSASVYVLFYQRQPSGSFPQTPASFDDSLEVKRLEQLLRLFKPATPQAACPPGTDPPLKRASSESNLPMVALGNQPPLLSALDLTPKTSAQLSFPCQPSLSSSNPNLRTGSLSLTRELPW